MASSSNSFGGTVVNDDFDMSDLVNLDQGFHNSPSPTNAKLEPRQSLDPRQIMLQQSSQPRQQYNGPSHNYDQFRQQTGLPTGALSHVHAVNQFSNSNHISGAQFGSYNTGFDFDFNGQAADDSQSFFPPGDGNTDEYAIDPATIAPDSQPATAFRAWPGMHSQQAKQQAQAEAEAKQQRHDEAMRSQQPLPSNFEQSFGGRSRSQTASEPQVNEQISRLLNQMRQNSNASADEDDEMKPNMSGIQGLPNSRKTEEDMDEDERLLASEEGKKLSSKERRQLRNKVSARAFRSRRKEYITQLEGEVATKANECNEMKMTNRHLLEQNRQLTQLCKTMLNHPAFGTFMEEMSNDPSLLNAFAPQQTSSSQSSSQSSQTPEQTQQPRAPQHQQQSVTHVGMSMVPETNLDLSMLNLGGNHWGNGSFQQPQIYAVHELPSGPSMQELQSSVLSGKDVQDSDSIVDAKLDAPTPKDLPHLPETEPSVSAAVDDGDISDIKDDPAFALYIDAPAPTESPQARLTQSLNRLEQSLSDKPSFFSLSVHTDEDEAQNVQAIDRMFAGVEGVMRRIETATHHLPL